MLPMHWNGENFIYEIKHAGDRQMDKFMFMKKFWPHRVVCWWRKAIYKDIYESIGIIYQISGERLQDHWSSGLSNPSNIYSNTLLMSI